MSTVLDYSGKPPRASIIKRKYDGVVRYIGSPGQRAKEITKAEAQSLTKTGVPFALVAELGASWMLDGWDAGVTMADRALTEIEALEIPGLLDDFTLYLACDFDARSDNQISRVAECISGAATRIPREKLGLYGGKRVIDALTSHVAKRWQTRAWSGGLVSAHADLLQEIGAVTVDGVECDRNTVINKDWGQFPSPEVEEDMGAVTPEQTRTIVQEELRNFATKRQDNATPGDPVDTFREMLDQFPELVATVNRLAEQVADIAENIGTVHASPLRSSQFEDVELPSFHDGDDGTDDAVSAADESGEAEEVQQLAPHEQHMRTGL